MITMFKNESGHIRRMLDSVAPYISYWVIQDNGSTDGTADIVKQWAEETKIPGHLYQVEEGWVGFGWNRDHLLQTCLKLDHGCDWIMKMDCDEYLEVDEDFDWNIFKLDVPSFHVTSIAPGCIYNRAWIWKAGLPWRFNHDPAHETICLDQDGIGENFHREQLPRGFRLIADGSVQGESYTVPTKYVTDALKLEERLIREGTMLTDLYHFWYIGKSYEDCYKGNFFPLQEIHQEEYANRCIFYFENYVKYKHGGLSPAYMDEMAYCAMCSVGSAYRYLKKYEKAIEYYELAGWFCTRRNEHVVGLAEVHWEIRDYRKMYYYTSILMDPARNNPFPELMYLINTNHYADTGKYPAYLHSVATQNLENTFDGLFNINRNRKKRIFVVDNFFDRPEEVRTFAMRQKYEEKSDWYKGRRTFERWLSPVVKAEFENIMGIKIREWESHGMNGKFQYCLPQDPLVYHNDSQTWAALIYLTPDAPFSTGTALYAHKQSRIRHIDESPEAGKCFSGGFYDKTKFELVDVVGNVFNRLVIFDARCFHAATDYFGQTIQDARLFQIFFFD